jgi:Transposase DDE domain
MTKPARCLPPEEEKAKYRVTNWSAYDEALVKRGNVTLWFAEEVIVAQWKPAATGKRGGIAQYSDMAIQTLLTLKAVFRLPYRSVEGLGRSLMQLMGLDLRIPDHTSLSRRAKTLNVVIPCRTPAAPLHIVVDSTGLKVYGEGEWKVRQHGVSKRRTWIKVHLAVDSAILDVVGVEVTTPEWTDAEVFEGLVEQIEGDIQQIDGDGAYDTRAAYETARKRNARLIVPPRDNAVPWEEGHPRTEALAHIAEQGLKAWKKSTNYHQRSLAENAMYRLKQLLGDRLSSRIFETQVTEVHVRIAAMNIMTSLGMPVSVRLGRVVS